MKAEDIETVVAELEQKLKVETGLEPLKDLVVDGVISNESLLLCALGSKEIVQHAKKPQTSRKLFQILEENLEMCMLKAFPTCTVVVHETQKRLKGKKFSGVGFDGLVRMAAPS